MFVRSTKLEKDWKCSSMKLIIYLILFWTSLQFLDNVDFFQRKIHLISIADSSWLLANVFHRITKIRCSFSVITKVSFMFSIGKLIIVNSLKWVMTMNFNESIFKKNPNCLENSNRSRMSNYVTSSKRRFSSNVYSSKKDVRHRSIINTSYACSTYQSRYQRSVSLRKLTFETKIID